MIIPFDLYINNRELFVCPLSKVDTIFCVYTEPREYGFQKYLLLIDKEDFL